MAGTAILGSAIIGGISTAFGASKAAKAQQQAAQLAAQGNMAAAKAAMDMYNQTREDLSPYRDVGLRSAAELENRMPELTSDIDVSKELQDPNSTIKKAYDFTRTQGLKAAQNSAAARGLGVSGAALKGATSFATGLADNTYQNLFNMENTNRTNAYNRLKGLVDTGVDAAKGTATAGTAAANAGVVAAKNTGDAVIGGGNAQAAAANATAGAVKQASQDVAGWAYGNERGMYGPNRLVDDVYFN